MKVNLSKTWVKCRVQQLIRGKEVRDYAELLDYLKSENMMLEYAVARENSYFFETYIASRERIKRGGK